MNFILDASFALTWVLKDEATSETDQVLDSLGKGAKAFVPALWRWEVANALLSVGRRKRATQSDITGHLLFFQSLPIEIDEMALHQAWNATHLLAQKHQLTSYDAAYLELAIRHGLPLASMDEALQIACKSEKVRIQVQP